MKKISAILLALIMMLSMVASAATITVSGAVDSQTYSVYKLLDLKYANNAYYYTVNEDWASFFAAAGKDYVEIAASGAVTWKSGADAQEFAQAALAYAQAEDTAIAAVGTATNGVYTADELGYYLVGTSLGSLVALDTNSGENITVYEKNDYPTLTKEVKEDSTGKFGEEATADEGEEVTFKLTVEIPDNDAYKPAENNVAGNGVNKDFVITDTIPAEMTYVGIAAGTPAYVTDTTATGENDTTVVTFTLPAEDMAALANGEVEIFYTAKLNNKAATATDYVNTAKLAYGTFETTVVDAKVKTFEISVYKWTGTETNGLAGAGFRLYKEIKADGAETATKWYFVKAADGAVTWTTDVKAATVYTTTEENNYTVTFDGVDADEYFVEECITPEGYNPLTSAVEATVTNANLSGEGVVDVENKTGSELPSTGGIGTTIFYTVGGLMMAAAIVLLVAKKKVAASK